MKRPVIAIDGPAGAGKSTVSRAVAAALGFRYVDTGAMYRALGVLARERGIPLDDAAALARLCDAVDFRIEDSGDEVRVFAGDRELTREIRTAEAGQLASLVSTLPAVRERMVAKQREMAAGGGVVMEGRDIGTVVCPDAAVKIFLDASPRERARRRALDLAARGEPADLAVIQREIEDRDARDRGRSHSPLRVAADAVMIDTTSLPVDEVIARVLDLVRRASSP